MLKVYIEIQLTNYWKKIHYFKLIVKYVFWA